MYYNLNKVIPMSTMFTVRIDDQLKEELDRLAEATQRSKSFLAAEALRAFVDLHSWQVNHIKKASEESKDNVGIPHEEMEAWVSSWGKKNELPPPKARKLR
jgi:RHH-type transcriptional regulator, rel operon repressor / antitoxin RelB